jgi:hypothetical protein
MNKLFTIIAVLGFVVLLPSCASVGAVIEGGKDVTTSIVDTSVKTAGNIGTAVLRDASDIVNTAADAAEGVVDTVVTEIDKQTDELQEPKKD